MRWLICLSLLVLLLGLKIEEAHSSCGQWRKRWKKLRLLLPKAKQRKLIVMSRASKRPKTPKFQRRVIRRYRRIVKEVHRIRSCYRRRYRRLKQYRSRLRLLRKIEKTMKDILTEAVMPLWLGTPWAYTGTAEIPHQKAIACGYFVVHMFRAIGFRFPQNFYYTPRGRAKMRIFKFAKQAAGKMVTIMSSQRWTFWSTSRSMKDMKRGLKRLGAGIYIIGLDSHVGILIHNGRTPYFWHSGRWVERENAYTAIDIVQSKARIIGRIRPSRWIDWLYRRPVRVK